MIGIGTSGIGTSGTGTSETGISGIGISGPGTSGIGIVQPGEEKLGVPNCGFSVPEGATRNTGRDFGQGRERQDPGNGFTWPEGGLGGILGWNSSL